MNRFTQTEVPPEGRDAPENSRKSRRLPLLLLLCAGLGLLLVFASGSFSESTGKDGGAAAEDRKATLTALLSGVEGVGKTEIYMETADDGGIQGIAVLCEGGEDPGIQKKVIDLLSALYGVGAHRIFVGGLSG